MAGKLQDQILEQLRQKPNQKADELASKLQSSKTEVNQLLYGALRKRVMQNSSYRWSLVDKASQEDTTNDASPYADTDLARICRYYLSCLGHDDTGASVFLTSNYGDPDYIELDSLPQTMDSFAEHEGCRKLLGRKRSERGRYGLYFGYPTSLALLKSKKSDWQGLMVEPLLLFPIDTDEGRITVDLSSPIINQKPFQALTNTDRDLLMTEIVQLENELGLNSEERIPIDDIAMRLQAIRPEWPWKEDINPESIETPSCPMAELTEPGIYNRAVIFMAEKSPYTQGLEKELKDLATLPARDYESTALGRWLTGSISNENISEFKGPLLEVLPMNLEQREAVTAALTRPVTIITGPPGTGKSQVVTNLLINAAWTGKRVLFASKNNKAVDVVETRVNALGSRPILLRVGAQAYQAKVAEYVLSLLSSVTTASEKTDFAEAKLAHESLIESYTRLATESQTLIELRNRVDRLELLSETARESLGPLLFAMAPKVDLDDARVELNSLNKAVTAADRDNLGFPSKVMWPVLRKGREQALQKALKSSHELLTTLELSLPQDITKTPKQRKLITDAFERLDTLAKVQNYFDALSELQKTKSLEEISKNETALLKRIARHSEMLWKLWLRIQPAQISSRERQNLGRYSALLKMVIEAKEQGGDLTREVYKQYSAMLKEISHLMPCWAVTSLSAKGRIPFEAGIFDIVIFDEASQCDIASALPLLYRAKSIVIIGDPKQLSHISGLQRGQDRALLERFGLLQGFSHWSYSHQSLFGLGATLVSGQDVISLVDHHRCHADIIQFANKEFYEERLRIATSYANLKSPNRDAPGIRWIDAKGHVTRPFSGGAVNHPEAKAVVASLRDLFLVKGYAGSVGVVTPFRAQANAINELVNKDQELEAKLFQHGFLADTVHKFQGDERDIIIFSPVVAAGTPQGALGFLQSNGNLFNVAITRARAQLIVVGDLSSCSSSEVGYLARFAHYVGKLKGREAEKAQILSEDLGGSYPKVADPSLVSDWEKHFYKEAHKAGYRLIPQYPVEKYLADFLLIKEDRKLVIEIDGERYHRNWNGELCRRDQIRNQRMFELGYDVMRFWVYEVRDDLSGCLAKLKSW